MEAFSDGAGAGHFKSIKQLERDHNYAVTSCLGMEKKEHLAEVIRGVKVFLGEYAKGNTLIDSEAKEAAEALLAQAQADMQATDNTAEAEDDNRY